MKNLVQEGDVLTLAAPYDVAAGAGLKVGAIVGVASTAALSGANVEVALEGVYSGIAALSTDTGTPGTMMYWDDTNKRLTTTASTHAKAGVLTVAKTNGETTATIRLQGSF